MSLLNFSYYLPPPPPQPPLATHPANAYQQRPQQFQLFPSQRQEQPYIYPSPNRSFSKEDYPNTPSTPNYQNPQKTANVNEEIDEPKVHSIIDYDDYPDEEPILPHVTPIQGPIFIKNGSVPVVPLYSHPILNNGTYVQIPILWTALSVALGLEIKGQLIKGVPCIKKHNQLMCPTAGNSYPIDRIELFIDENKALMKRMYGEFGMNFDEPVSQRYTSRVRKRSTRPGVPDIHFNPELDDPEEDEFFHSRKTRQNFKSKQASETGRIDACESKVEIVTPYWASNSAGKVRAIVNTQHFEQAIHQEVCSKTRTSRCTGDCACEQKYKWHRLLAYDPDNDCKGIFMDWFLFPSCCVCRCSP